MIAAKHFDPIMGVDIHIVTIPPVGPVPIPHPHISLVIDPMDYVPILGGTVLVGGIHRGTAGTAGLPIPHIPMGGPFVKPPGNEDEIFMGSATVLADGAPFTFTALPVLSCQDVGIPAPIRAKKPKKSYGLLLPTSVVISVPAGMPVMVGGPPTIDMMGMAFAAGFKALGAMAKKLRGVMKKSDRIKGISDAIHARARRGMNALGVPPNAQNRVHRGICSVTGHPVDIASGKVITEACDFSLPGPIPIRWERVWYSCSSYSGPLGCGWHHCYDQKIYVDKRAISLRLEDGRSTAFPPLRVGETAYSRAEKLWLHRDPEHLVVQNAQRLRYEFEQSAHSEQEWVLVCIRDPSQDAVVQFQYDISARLAGITDCVGRVLRFHYDDRDRIIQIDGPDPDVESKNKTYFKAHYAGSCLTAVSDIIDRRWQYFYEGNLLVRERNRNGLDFVFEYERYDDVFRCVHTWGSNGIYDHTLRYDDEISQTEVRDSLGNITLYKHNGSLVTEERRSDGSVFCITFNSDYEKLLEVGPLGETYRYEYDDRGFLASVTYPNGSSYEITRDHFGRMNSAKNRSGAKWCFEYDDWGRLIERTEPLGKKTYFRYEGAQLTEIFSSNGEHKRLHYDQWKNLNKVVKQNTFVWRAEWDHCGRLLRTRDERGAEILYAYDPAGRVISVDKGSAGTRFIAYDGEDNVTRVQENSLHYEFVYQGLNQLIQRSQNGVSIYLEYDTEENLKRIRNPLGAEHSFEIDSNFRLVQETRFDGLQLDYQRDMAGRIVKVEKSNGKHITVKYDKAGEVSETRYSDGGFTKSCYRDDGELVSIENPFCKVSYEKDCLGNVLCEDRDGVWIKSTYDAYGNRTCVESSVGKKQKFSRNFDGTLRRLESDDSHSVEFGYDPFGLETRRAFSNGITVDQDFDEHGRISNIKVESSNRSLHFWHYEWCAGSVLESISEQGVGISRYIHDQIGFLIGAKYPDGLIQTRMPDHLGNIFTDPGCQEGQYDAAGRLLRLSRGAGVLSYRYDSEGRVVSKTCPDGTRFDYTWDDCGNLLSATRSDGVTSHFGYDGLGRRIWKRTGDQICYWLWDGDVPVHEWRVRLSDTGPSKPVPLYSVAPLQAIRGQRPQARAPPLSQMIETSKPITWIFHPDSFTLLAADLPSGRLSVVSDHLGTPIEAYDDAGKNIFSVRLDVFGKPRTGVLNEWLIPFRWPGQYADEDTGLYYNRHRYYDPDAGRYISQDPIGLAGGPHPYAYVDDPLVWLDPLGLAACHDSGRRGSAAARADLENNGFDIVGEEVTMIVNGSRVRADFVARRNGETFVIEAKNGRGRLTRNQQNAGVYDLNSPSNTNPGVDPSQGTSGSFEVATDNRPTVGARGDTEDATFMTMVYDV